LNNSDDSGGGRKPVRIEDVAREAGVSPITVSRALSAPDKLRPATLKRVLEAVAKTGYVVNPIASSLRSGQSPVVTVFVASLHNPHFASALQGVLDAFEGSRYQLMFTQTGYAETPRDDVIEIVRRVRPAAVMFTGICLPDTTRDTIRRFAVPTMEMWGDGGTPIDMVAGASIHVAARSMGQHFAAQGYRHIAYCGQTKRPGGAGLAGFREGLEAAGARLDHVHAVEGTGTMSAGMSAFSEIRTALPGCDAIFFGSDVLAVGAIIAARDLRVDLPGDVAIAGYGDLDFARHMKPALTTIQVADYNTGRLAGAAVRTRLEGGKPLPVIEVPVRLMVRDSTPRR
jgi:LacI family gluconate utilization system Gnt-I transcriptional repressor